VTVEAHLPIAIGISSRALFRVEDEDTIFEQESVQVGRQNPIDAEDTLLEQSSALN
jgi:hypothetical protein